MTDDDFPTRAMKQKAGHQEILGETLAKFEFFQNGWHPYSRFLDIDKVDLILRRRLADKIGNCSPPANLSPPDSCSVT
jgi:hypothetical protein